MSDPRCPYCLETVNANAQKCRHCGSSLGKSEPSPTSSGEITYVIDKGIVRFGKFAIAILALVIALGSYIFAFDTKELVKEMHQVRADLDVRRAELAAATEQIATAKAQLAAAQTGLSTAQNELDEAKKASPCGL
jgi:hypothetical protein